VLKRVCVFVDGENFRHTIVDLFTSFNQADYLPKNGGWEKFFDWLVDKVVTPTGSWERVRTYWYVIQHIDFFPYKFPDAMKFPLALEKLLIKHSQHRTDLATLTGQDKIIKMQEIVKMLRDRQNRMRRRFDGWNSIHNGIAGTQKAIEFRRAGGIRYNLFEDTLGTEKAVDVKLATDLLELRPIYDIAVIVSGDQDYVPAVEIIKNSGKSVVNVAFKTRGGQLLPGGAWRLNITTDWSYEVTYNDFKDHLKL